MKTIWLTLFFLVSVTANHSSDIRTEYGIWKVKKEFYYENYLRKRCADRDSIDDLASACLVCKYKVGTPLSNCTENCFQNNGFDDCLDTLREKQIYNCEKNKMLTLEKENIFDAASDWNYEGNIIGIDLLRMQCHPENFIDRLINMCESCQGDNLIPEGSMTIEEEFPFMCMLNCFHNKAFDSCIKAMKDEWFEGREEIKSKDNLYDLKGFVYDRCKMSVRPNGGQFHNCL